MISPREVASRSAPAGVRPSLVDHGTSSAKPLRRLFRDGVVVNALNPKVALFFFAFLPLRFERYVSGAVFVGLGVVAAVTGHRRAA